MNRLTLCAILLMPVLASAAMFNIVGIVDPTPALNEFSRQSGVQMLFNFNLIKYLHINDISGEMQTADALRAMLKDSGLEFAFVNDRTVTITLESEHVVDSETFARWMESFDNGPAISYPYDNTQPPHAMTLVLPTGEEIQYGSVHRSMLTRR